MKRAIYFTLSTLLLCILIPSTAWMDEGMWLLDSVEKLPLSKMKAHGLKLTAKQIFNPKGTSLTDAIVLLPGGTGGFISNEGLIITNHHIAFAGIQSLSSVHDDYLKNGFLARTKDAELSTSYTAEIVTGISDITSEVLSATSDTTSNEERAKVIQAKMRSIEGAAKGSSLHTFRASELYNGVKYYLFEFETLRDVRLVYAPPGSIGNYGGEVDNWTWPRHTGDFALMRAYVGPDGKPAKFARENVPYTPRTFLPISSKGAVEGAFAMIMGFPGRTFRYREYPAVKLAHDESLPATIALFKKRVDVVDAIGKHDRGVEIQYASKIRRIANAYKNYLGTLEGMRRANFLSKKGKEFDDFAAWIDKSEERKKKYGDLLEEMKKATANLQSINRRNILYTNITGAAELLNVSNRFITFATNLPKDSSGQVLLPTDKERGPVREYLGTFFKDFDIRVDKEMMVQMLLAHNELPEDQRMATLKEIVGDETGTDAERTIRDFVEDLYNDTELKTKESCEELLMKEPDDILDDPFVKLMSKLGDEQLPITAQVNEYNSTIGRLRGRYVQAFLIWKSQPVTYPDANRSLRMTYGLVEPLAPRDAVSYSFVTTLGGIMEKETGEEPFIVPQKLKDLWTKRDFGSYADPSSGDVPVAFIANLDITGGNSGSPVINGKGELIGCSFDGNWEAVVGDYYFQHKYNRAINVDSRYILFILDKFEGADNILKELVIR